MLKRPHSQHETIPYRWPAAPHFQSAFLEIFAARGAYYDCSAPGDLDALFGKERVTAYIGFDCTAEVLHVGSLVQIMTAAPAAADRPPAHRLDGRRHHQGRRSVRQRRNAPAPDRRRDRAQHSEHQDGVRHLLNFGDGPTDAIMVNNADWLDELDYIPFLRDVGRHFSVNRMLTFD